MADDTALRALTLRMMGGDYDGIAEELGITRAAAEAYVDAELITRQRPGEDTVRLDLARLDTMLMFLWPKVRQGDVKAITEAGKITDRKRILEDQLEPEKESDLDRAREKRRKRLESGA